MFPVRAIHSPAHILCRAVILFTRQSPKSALARDLGDCRDNKGKLEKRVFTCYGTQRERTEMIFHRKRGMHI